MMGKAGFAFFLVFLSTSLSASFATTQTNSSAKTTVSSPLPAPSPGPADVESSTSFIISSCAYNTLYPRLCSRTLTPYASAVRTSTRRLAYAAVDAAEQRASDSSALVNRLYGLEKPSDANSMLSGSSPTQHSLAGPLRDCAETMSDSLDRLRMSAREMRRMGLPFDSHVVGEGDRDRAGEAGNEFESHLSNVQTWMSAALTDQTTCLDGFDEELGPGTGPDDYLSSSSSTGTGRRGTHGDPVAAVVRKSVLHVSHMTSNALALINRIDTPGPH